MICQPAATPNLSTWSSTILAHAKQGRTEEVIRLYVCMHQLDLRPSTLVFVAVLKACSRAFALPTGRLVHSHAFQMGYGSHLFVANTLIDMYAKCGSLKDACTVFIMLIHRDVVSWNAMIAGCLQHGQCDEAFQLVQQMFVEGVGADHLTFICILQACSDSMMVDAGKMTHACIIERGLQSNICVGNTLIDMYCKCEDIKNARVVFDALTNKTIVSWNAMIAGYAQHRHGDEAIELFRELLNGYSEPNKTTCISMLKACSRVSASTPGKLIHLYVIELDFHTDECVASVLVDMYNKCGGLEDAQAIFDRLSKRDVVMWSAMVLAYVCHGYFIKSLDLFEQMQREGTEPNDVTYLSILKACSNLQSLEKGKHVHDCIKASGFKSSTCVGNALIDMYFECEDFEDAHDVFKKLSKRSVATWNTMIGGNAQHGFFEEALLLFQKMQEEGFEPNDITFASVLSACNLADGKLIHCHMLECDFEPYVLALNALVDMYVRFGSLEDGCKVFGRLPTADVATWSTIIGECARRTNYESARRYFECMQEEGLKPNDVTFVCLISACSHAGLIEEGFCHFKSMTDDYGILPNLEHYICMIDLFGRMGRLCDAENLLQTMPFEPTVSIWTSLLSHCKTHGNAQLGKLCCNAVLTWDTTHVTPGYALISSSYAGPYTREIEDKCLELTMCSYT